MKNLLSKISFCAVVLLSCICYSYTNSADLTLNKDVSVTEVQTPNDKLIGSVKAVTLVFSKVIDVLSNRGKA